MAFKLSKADKNKRDKLVSRLTNARSALEYRIKVYNENLESQNRILQDTLSKYHTVVAEANEFVTNIVQRSDDEMELKSDRWFDSMRRDLVNDWVEEWGDSDFVAVDIVLPEFIEYDNDNHAEILENLPEKPKTSY